MIDISKIVPDFKQVDLQAIINTTPLNDLAYPSYFPSQYTSELTFTALEAIHGATVTANIVAFDSRAPRKGRPTPGKIAGDIPKIEVARVKMETDINRYRNMLNNANATKNAAALESVINWMYEDSEFCLQAVRARVEWLAKKAVSDGKYTLSATNNDGGIVTKTDIAFGIKPSHRKGVSALWTNTSTAKPITDIKKIQSLARTEGYALKYAITDYDTMQRILLADETQKFVSSYIAVSLNMQSTPTVEQLNFALAAQSLPTFRVWDSYIAHEGKDGVVTSETGWVTGHVNFSVTPILGSVQWTDTADAIVTVDNSSKATNDFVLIKVFAEEDPISVVTKAVTYATPVLNGANQMWIMDSTIIEV